MHKLFAPLWKKPVRFPPMNKDAQAPGAEAFDAVLAMLQHIHPKDDFESLRKEMIFRFGSANALFTADRHIWQQLGIKPNDALLVSRIADITRYAEQTRHSSHPRLDTLQQTTNYLVSNFHGLQTERFYMFCLDKQGRLKERLLLYDGTTDCTLLNLCKMLQEAVHISPAMILLAHNHPGGTMYPSQEDADSTWAAIRALSTVGIPVLDHLIVAGNRCISLRTSGIIPEAEWVKQQPENRFLCTWPERTGE